MERLRFSNSTTLRRVSADDILYVKADGNYSEFHLSNNRTFTITRQLGKVKEIFDSLKHNPFIYLGRSYIVNQEYISYIGSAERKLKVVDYGQAVEKDIDIHRVITDDLKKLIEKLKNE